jgi:hypothetical protein
MILLRRIDYYGQCTLGVIMCLSIPVLIIYGFLAGLFLIGCWQLISAAFNTHSFICYGLHKEISVYWKWTGLIMGILFLCIPLSYIFNVDDLQVLCWIGVIASIPVAILYLSSYSKLITAMEARKEVSGLIKSK